MFRNKYILPQASFGKLTQYTFFSYALYVSVRLLGLEHSIVFVVDLLILVLDYVKDYPMYRYASAKLVTASLRKEPVSILPHSSVRSHDYARPHFRHWPSIT